MNNTLPVLFETTNYSLNGKEDKLFSLDRIYSNMILENYYNINNEIQNNEYDKENLNDCSRFGGVVVGGVPGAGVEA